VTPGIVSNPRPFPFDHPSAGRTLPSGLAANCARRARFSLPVLKGARMATVNVRVACILLALLLAASAVSAQGIPRGVAPACDGERYQALRAMQATQRTAAETLEYRDLDWRAWTVVRAPGSFRRAVVSPRSIIDGSGSRQKPSSGLSSSPVVGSSRTATTARACSSSVPTWPAGPVCTSYLGTILLLTSLAAP
jgi:hypothetical protein